MVGYGGFRLTDAGLPVIKGQQPVQLRRDHAVEKRRSTRDSLRRGGSAGRGDGVSHGAARGALSAEEDALWHALRARRTELARQQGVPPYVIFHDSTLMEMVHDRPRDRTAFARLPGVGARKLNLYADAFLEVIREHG